MYGVCDLEDIENFNFHLFVYNVLCVDERTRRGWEKIVDNGDNFIKEEWRRGQQSLRNVVVELERCWKKQKKKMNEGCFELLLPCVGAHAFFCVLGV